MESAKVTKQSNREKVLSHIKTLYLDKFLSPQSSYQSLSEELKRSIKSRIEQYIQAKKNLAYLRECKFRFQNDENIDLLKYINKLIDEAAYKLKRDKEILLDSQKRQKELKFYRDNNIEIRKILKGIIESIEV